MSPSLLSCALNPQSVAIIGASDNIHKIGGRPIHYMQRHGFAGRIYPINPQRERIQGLPSYASLAALPEAEQPAAFLQLWCHHEAGLKAGGWGLAAAPPADGWPPLRRWRLALPAGYVGAAALVSAPGAPPAGASPPP